MPSQRGDRDMETYRMHIHIRDGKYEAEIFSDYDDAYVGAYTDRSLSNVLEYARLSGYKTMCHWTYKR